MQVTCDFKSGKVILQQAVAREQMTKLLTTGATDLLEGFVSNKTRRKFKARLAWDAMEGKVVFAFEPRPERPGAAKKFAGRPRGTAATSNAPAAAASSAPAAADGASATKVLAKKVGAVKKAAKKVGAVREPAKPAARKSP